MTDPSADAPAIAARPVDRSPLDEADFFCLRQAGQTWHAVQRAAAVARFSAVTTLVIAVIGVPVVVFWPSVVGLVMLAGVWGVGLCEYAGYRRVRCGLPDAATWLGRNQLLFMVLIVAYCVLRLTTGVHRRLENESWTSQLDQLDPVMARQVAELIPVLTAALYFGVILLSVLVQGGMAFYYFTRRRLLLDWQRRTPGWVQRVFRELES